jgi:hypothetical protein
MHQIIFQYISECNKLYKSGNATEHSYRPALKTLLEALMPRYAATNEPKRITCGAPDYIITDRDIAVGYVEAKDIHINLNDKSLKEQFDKYRNSLDNLIITNYLTFRWCAKGELVEEIAIGRYADNNPIIHFYETFLAEVAGKIYKHFESHQCMWNDYVNEHLIPRLNGFEILMASYAMAHLKLEMLLQGKNSKWLNDDYE